MSSVPGNKPPKGSMTLIKKKNCNYIVLYTSMNIYIEISPAKWVTGRSAEQSLQDPNGGALNQSRPHPSNCVKVL